MPWRCPSCNTDGIDDDRPCPGCGAKKAVWTFFGEKTRRFVIAGKKVSVLRGGDATPRAADDPARADDAPVEAAEAVSLPKADARALARRGLLPASRDVLLVRLARGAKDPDVTLIAGHAHREAEEHHLSPLATPDAEGSIDVPIVLVHGPGGAEGIAFEGVHVVDITDAGPPGHAPQVSIVALRRPSARLPVTARSAGPGPWRMRLYIDPREASSLDDRFTLSSADGSYRHTRTVRDDLLPGDDCVDLEFPAVDEALEYSLEVDPGAQGARYVAFEGRRLQNHPPATVARIRLHIDPREASSLDDRFTLTSADLSYRHTLTVRDDLVAGDDWVDLEFPGIDQALEYTLEVDPGAEGAPYRLEGLLFTS